MNDVDDADDLCRYQSEYLVWYRGASRRTVEDRVKDRRRECYDLLYMLRIRHSMLWKSRAPQIDRSDPKKKMHCLDRAVHMINIHQEYICPEGSTISGDHSKQDLR